MRKKLTNNSGLKLLSLISAFVIWLVILSIEDPIKTKSLVIDVEIKGEEELEERGQTYEITSDQKVTISISGKTSVVDWLKSSDFVATADLTQLTIMDTIPITVTALRYADQITIIQQEHTLPLNIDVRAQETVKVTVTPIGTAADNFSVAGTSASPNIVTVSGPKAAIEKIGKVEVTCDINGQSETVVQTLEPVVYDKNGDVMGNNIKLNVETVEATITIYPIKEVGVRLETSGIPADGYSVTEIKKSQERITITGPPEALKDIEEIVLPDVDVTGADASKEGTVVLADVLTNTSAYGDILLADTEDPEIAYTINITKDKTSSIELPFSEIQIRNQSEGLNYIGEDITLSITGTESEIKATNSSNITASIDVNGLEEGSHEVPLVISFSTAIGLVSDVKVKVNIESK